MTRGIFYSIVFIAFILLSASENINAAQNTPPKRIYITSFERKNGLSEDISEKIRNQIKITMLEKSGDFYRIISDEDIKVMFKKAESLQAAGCADEGCNLDIAQAIKADEIIYGSISRESGKIKLNVYNLEISTGKKGKGAGVKSMVSEILDESSLEWMSRQIALKLINPKYTINRAPVFEGRVSIDPIEIVPVKKGDIKPLQFKNSESSLNAILEYYKGLIDDGDNYFSEGKYDEAYGKYREVLISANTKMTAENRKKIAPLLNSVVARLSSTLSMKYKLSIERIDKSISSKSSPSESDYKDAFKDYEKIEFTIREELGATGVSDTLNYEILKILEGREDIMLTAIVAITEKEGDNEFSEFRFADALKKYRKGRDMARFYSFIPGRDGAGNGQNAAERRSVRRIKAEKNLDNKIDVTMNTGRKYLDNIVSSYIDQAEFYNVTNNSWEAKGSMKKARKSITGKMKIFTTAELIDKYNRSTVVIPGSDPIDERTKKELIAPVIQVENKEYPFADNKIIKGIPGCIVSIVLVVIIVVLSI